MASAWTSGGMIAIHRVPTTVQLGSVFQAAVSDGVVVSA
jgi:hypothetical protein